MDGELPSSLPFDLGVDLKLPCGDILLDDITEAQVDDMVRLKKARDLRTPGRPEA